MLETLRAIPAWIGLPILAGIAAFTIWRLTRWKN